MGAKLIDNLIEIGKLDSQIARILIEKNQAVKKYNDIDKSLNQRALVLSEKSNLLKSKQEKYSQEERNIKEERQKLVDRRKAIYSFNDYKVQQTAQKEIEFASKQLDAREEHLIPVLDEIEILKKDYDNVFNDCKALKQSLDKLKNDKIAIEANYKKREEESLQKRDKIIQDIPREALQEYNKAKVRNPIDPVVAITSDSLCGGCSMKLGSQILVEVSRGDRIIRCPGCNRVLYIANDVFSCDDDNVSDLDSNSGN